MRSFGSARHKIGALVMATAVIFALGGCAVVSVNEPTGSTKNAAPRSGLPDGYESFPLGKNPQLEVGKPWGSPCEPVSVLLVGNPTEQLDKQARRVIKEARSFGIDVTFMHFAKGTDPTSSGQLTVTAHLGRAPINPSSGSPLRYVIAGNYVRNRDSGAHRLYDVTADMYLSSLGRDKALLRKAWRAIVAVAVGLHSSATTSRSGITDHLEDSVDAYSEQDIEAMLQMSGCERSGSLG
jgi:hypothetical protein